MTLAIVPRHDLSPFELDAVEVHLYAHNSSATGRDDAQGLGFMICDGAGKIDRRCCGLYLVKHVRNQADVGRYRASGPGLRASVAGRFHCRGQSSRCSPDLGGQPRFPSTWNVRKSWLQTHN